MSESMFPLVSVLVFAEQESDFLEDSLRSVWEQDYPAIELVVVEKDRSLHAQKLTSAPWFCQRFIGIKHPCHDGDKEPELAINLALATAAGTYFCLLKAGDAMAANRVSTLLQMMQTQPGRMAFSGFHCIDLNGEISAGPDLYESVVLEHSNMHNYPAIGFGFLKHSLAATTGNIMMHRSLYEEIGGLTPVRDYYSVWEYALRVLAVENPVFCPAPLYQIRIQHNSEIAPRKEGDMIEREIVLRRYFRNSLYGRIQNPYAPSPYHWPRLFDTFLQINGLRKVWNAVAGIDPPQSRMLD